MLAMFLLLKHVRDDNNDIFVFPVLAGKGLHVPWPCARIRRKEAKGKGNEYFNGNRTVILLQTSAGELFLYLLAKP